MSSLTTQITKAILNDFEFPIFVAEFQFFFNLILGLLTIKLASTYSGFRDLFPNQTFPENKFVFNKSLIKLFFPMGTFQFVGKLFSLAATSICPIATVSSIRSLSPLFIVLGYRLHYKVHFPLRTYLSLIPLLCGVIIIVLSESKNELNIMSGYNEIDKNDEIDSSDTSFLSTFISNLQFHGIFYAILSTSVFAAGSIYAKNVISNNLSLLSTSSISKDKLDLEKNSTSCLSIKKIDKLSTLVYCSIYGLIYSVPALLTYELPILFSSKLYPDLSSSTTIPIYYYNFIPWKLLIINGFSYFIQSLLAFHILSILPTIPYSISNMLKRIIIISISILLNGNKLCVFEWIGLANIFIGLYVYERWGK